MPRHRICLVVGFSYVSTWSGSVYVAFVIYAYARGIVGWRVSGRHTSTSYWTRWSKRYTNKGPFIEPAWSVIPNRGAIRQHPIYRAFRRSGDRAVRQQCGGQLRQRARRNDHGLYKAKVIHRHGPWRSFEAVEFATLTWGDWFNNRRLLEPIGNIPSS